MLANVSRFFRKKSWLAGTAIALILATPMAVVPFMVDAQPAVKPSTIAPGLAPPAEYTLAPIAAKISPAVVSVTTRGQSETAQVNPFFNDPFFRHFFDFPEGQMRPQPRTGAGSGVIVDARRGYIITNHHVIDDADEITVTLRDRRTFTAKLIGSDKLTDIALLQIEADDLVAAPIGDSTSLQVGDYVIAIGNPFGLGHTVTAGIVSALGRSGINVDSYEDFIQTDASINPGNSGGPLINLKGEVVGINSAIMGPSGSNVGIGFAVPSAMMRSVMDQLIEHGEVSRGQIGIMISNLTPDVAANLGVSASAGALVNSVVPDSPADRAGIEAGDVVTALNDAPVDATSLRNRIGLMRSGTTVELDVLRAGKTRELRVTIGKAEEVDEAREKDMRPALEGASFSATGRGDKAKGIRVDSVAEGSAAERLNLRAGDIITSINRKPVASLREFYDALDASPRQAVLFIKRGDQDVLVIVP